MASQEQVGTYGHFGSVSAEYHVARKEFSPDAIRFILDAMPESDTGPRMLDVGAGTGIATAQLHDGGAQVVGADIDPGMIRVAKRQRRDIPYAVAQTRDLPFGDNYFDGVTAFSAFHWFADGASVAEVKRVLKPEGGFFVVNKNESGTFKEGYKEILRRYMSLELPDAKQGYEPEAVLCANGLRHVGKQRFPSSEVLSPDEALAHVQSVSWWEFVDDKGQATEEVARYIDQSLNDSGQVERHLNTTVIFGIK